MLRLAALDQEDLGVISAHMQDAVLTVAGIAYKAQRRQFALVANRFAWDDANLRQRRRTGLHFDRVTAVRTLRIRMTEKDAVLSLLSVEFTPTEAPAGDIVLTFSGGGSIRLTVECIEAQMRDLGPAWPASSTPHHPIDDTA